MSKAKSFTKKSVAAKLSDIKTVKGDNLNSATMLKKRFLH